MLVLQEVKLIFYLHIFEIPWETSASNVTNVKCKHIFKTAMLFSKKIKLFFCAALLSEVLTAHDSPHLRVENCDWHYLKSHVDIMLISHLGTGVVFKAQ